VATEVNPSLDFDNAQLAEQYERVSLERQFRSGQLLVKELDLKPGERVLDIGAGTGLLAEYAAGLVGDGGLVIGIDPLPHRIEIAKGKARPNLHFQVGNAFDLSEFAENQFDAIYMNAVFHWLAEKREPLRQIFRILKPGGRLGISTGAKGDPNPLRSARAIVLAREPYKKYIAASPMVIHRVSIEEMRSLLVEAGFGVKLVEARPISRPQVSPEEAMVFSEASSFGNFLGHLPEELRAQAREEIIREAKSTGVSTGPPRERLQIVGIAIKA
jgi:arsenite methyltransferase